MSLGGKDHHILFRVPAPGDLALQLSHRNAFLLNQILWT